jgi:small subunit ribosomal protein S15
MINKEVKLDIITQHSLSEGDTGSAGVQVALLTKRINLLTEHLKVHSHDCHSRRALYKILGQRRRFLSYLKRKDTERYYSLNNKLGLRS